MLDGIQRVSPLKAFNGVHRYRRIAEWNATLMKLTLRKAELKRQQRYIRSDASVTGERACFIRSGIDFKESAPRESDRPRDTRSRRKTVIPEKLSENCPKVGDFSRKRDSFGRFSMLRVDYAPIMFI